MTDNAAIVILRRLMVDPSLSEMEREAIRHAFVSLAVEKGRRDMRPLLDALKDAGD